MNYCKPMYEACLKDNKSTIRNLFKNLNALATVYGELDDYFLEVNNKCWDLDNGFDHEISRKRCDMLLPLFYEELQRLKELYYNAEKPLPQGCMSTY